MASHPGFTPSVEDAEALAHVESHWAVRAVTPAVRARALAGAERWWTKPSEHVTAVDAGLAADIGTLATAYDLAALEYLDAVALPLAPGATRDRDARGALRIGAGRSFYLQAVLPAPQDAGAGLYRLMHLAALSVVGDRAGEFARWLEVAGAPSRERLGALGASDRGSRSTGADWESALLDRTALVWLELLPARRGPDALARVIEMIALVREGRDAGERAFLQRLERADAARAAATRFRLFALYHLVDAAAALTTYLGHGEPADILVTLGRHFAMARAAAVGDPRREIPIAWLHGAAAIVADGRTEQLTLPGMTR